MAENSLRVVQVNTLDNIGGAALVAWSLHQTYRERGINSRMAVGHKFSNDPDVVQIPNEEARPLGTKFLLALARSRLINSRIPGMGCLKGTLEWTAEPRRHRDTGRGKEDFDYPGTWRLLKLFSARPDILHCHNLHGHYFDLRSLPWLSQKVPTIVTLHDAWLFGGHCAHSFRCQQWKTGCGNCPDLGVYEAIAHDATNFNWNRKRQIFLQSKLYLSAPSRWLLDRAQESILAPAICDARVIPNGIDCSVFLPADKGRIRQELGFPVEVRIALFAALGVRGNVWKDYEMMRKAITRAGEKLKGQQILFLALGEEAPDEQIGNVTVRFVPYKKERAAVAPYYQAADVYLHAARADTFPNTIIEALACGTPVIATAVGGIPEQVRSLRLDDIGFGLSAPYMTAVGLEQATGILVAPGDAEAMGEGIALLLKDATLTKVLGENGSEDCRARFSLMRQADEYVQWYRTILQSWKGRKQNGLPPPA